MISCRNCSSKNVKLFHRVDKYSYYKCYHCQTLFLHPQPTKKKLDLFYKKNFNYVAGQVEEKRIRQRARIILKKLQRLNPHGKTLLDIGSGYGFFLDEAKKFGLKTIGIEPSKKLSNVSIYRYIDTDIYQGTFEQYIRRLKNTKYDFVTAIHLIEHLPDPFQFIRQTSQLMNKNGILYIETPNLDSHLFRAEKENYTFLTPPEHLWIFSKKSFQTIIKNNTQLKIITTSSYSYPEHFMGIVKKKLQITNDKLQINFKYQNTNKKIVKYILFDRIIASILTPFLNQGIYGSILELYIGKN